MQWLFPKSEPQKNNLQQQYIDINVVCRSLLALNIILENFGPLFFTLLQFLDVRGH